MSWMLRIRRQRSSAIVVDLLLNELGAGGKPRLTVLNKVDLLGPFERSGLHGLTGKEEPQMVSARTGEGLPDLITAIARLAAEQFIPVDLVLPYDKTGWISRIEQQGKIESIEYTEAGIQVKAGSVQRCSTPCSGKSTSGKMET
jgi:GTP-binding protein HflX